MGLIPVIEIKPVSYLIIGKRNDIGMRKIAGIEFKTGYGYVTGKRNKSG